MCVVFMNQLKSLVSQVATVNKWLISISHLLFTNTPDTIASKLHSNYGQQAGRNKI